jgi:small-conductance mechanosensitive channel
MTALLRYLPMELAWVRAMVMAIAITIAGTALFRLVIRPLVRWLYQAEPDHAKALLSHLVPPFLITLFLLAGNAFRGLFGRQVDWWLQALLVPAIAVFAIETVRLGVVDYWLHVRRQRAVPRILRDIAFGLVYAIAALAYVGAVFKVDLAPFLTTSAILSVVIGMALQDTLGNVFAGLAINLDRPFNIGDWVSVDGEVGRVVEITWRATKISTLRREMHLIPNNAISKARVINYHMPTTTYAEAVDLSVGSDVPPSLVRDLVASAAREVRGVLTDPAPEVLLLKYGDSAIQYRIHLWVNDFGESLRIRGQFQERLWYQLQRRGVELPLPTQSVQVNDAMAKLAASQDETLRALRRIDVLCCMDSESLARLAGTARLVHYAAGERIFSQGDSGDSLYLIKRGVVTLSLDEMGGHDTRPFATLGEGGFFGEMSLLTGELRTASAHAADDCEFLLIDHVHLAPLLEDHPEFMRTISVTIAQRKQSMEAAKETIHRAKELIIPAQQVEAVEQASNEIFNRIRSFFKLT